MCLKSAIGGGRGGFTHLGNHILRTPQVAGLQEREGELGQEIEPSRI